MGSSKKTKDENVWRLEETELESGNVCWTGLVDDSLLTGEEEAAQGCPRALSEV